MTVQERVSPEQMREILELAALRSTPAALTCRLRDTWQTYRSRFVGLRHGQMWLEYGRGAPEQIPAVHEAGQRIGVAFKWRHHKYVFSAMVGEVADFQHSPQVRLKALRIAWPTEMHQLQRRVFFRVDVPDGRLMHAHFWEGGLSAEPTGQLRDKLVYCGQVVDLSAGGFRVRLLAGGDPGFQVGAVIGVELKTDSGGEAIKLDAQFRHTQADEFGVTLGLQIMGLTETSRGRKTLERIGRIMREFQRGRRHRVAS